MLATPLAAPIATIFCSRLMGWRLKPARMNKPWDQGPG
jgi:hypothetical protein